jgi:hypothetical protein
MASKLELEIMRRMASRGGRKAAQNMTGAQRKDRATKANRAAARKRSKEARRGKA